MVGRRPSDLGFPAVLNSGDGDNPDREDRVGNPITTTSATDHTVQQLDRHLELARGQHHRDGQRLVRAPYRIDRAGHKRDDDTPAKRSQEVLTADEARRVRMNVMWVTAQVLGYNDPNFDVYEFAEACGINTRNSRGGRNGTIDAGLRSWFGEYMRPGTWKFDPVTEVITTETSDDYHASAQCSLFRNGYKGAPLLRFAPDKVPAQWKPCQCMSLNRD